MISRIVSVAEAVWQAIVSGHGRPAVHSWNSRVGAAIVSAATKIDATTLTIEGGVRGKEYETTVASYPGSFVGIAPENNIAGVRLY